MVQASAGPTVGGALPRPGQIDLPGFDLRASDTVLDVGCGPGDVCAYAGSLGADVIGVDVEPELVERTAAAVAGTGARSFRGVAAGAESLPLEDGCADAIVCTEVLEHVDDPVAAARELARAGRPGARYLVSVPDPMSEELMQAVAPSWYFRKPYHVRIFEGDALADLLRSVGLRVEARHTCGAYWSFWWALRMSLGEPKPYEPVPESALLRHWEGLWDELGRAPGGPSLARALDRLVPKSQVIVASKPGGSASSFGGPRLARRLRGWARDGRARVGPIDLSWKARYRRGDGR